MKRVGRAIANWLIMITVPVWCLPVFIYANFTGEMDIKQWGTGKKWWWEG